MKYICGVCKKNGVKLWREYNTFLNHQHLYCLECACKNQNKVRTPTEDGKSLYTDKIYHWFRPKDAEPKDLWHSYDPKIGVADDNEIWEERERTDQIGWLVPAVPTEDGSFWGYSSVPQEACNWWYKLPY